MKLLRAGASRLIRRVIPPAGIRRIRQGARFVAARVGWYGVPHFLVAGVQKAGTTALFQYLGQHPSLAGSIDKEIYFFSPESVRGWTDHPDHPLFERLLRDGFEPAPRPWAARWYHAHFPLPLPGRARLNFEATPDYFHNPLSPSRIRAYRPEMKAIVLLRDPVERAFSAWNMFHRLVDPPYLQLRDGRPFEDAVREEIATLDGDPMVGSDYVRRGLYALQLRRWLDCFPRDRILVVESGELKAHPLPTLRKVCRFVQAPPFPQTAELAPVFVSRYESEMPSSARELLTEFYAPHNEALFELLGQRYDWGK